jgi:hypothetical protein
MSKECKPHKGQNELQQLQRKEKRKNEDHVKDGGNSLKENEMGIKKTGWQ